MSVAVFYILSGVIIFSALTVVGARNLFHSGIALITCFLGVAGIYLLLQNPYLAALQILIYAGAIAIVLLFAFMLTQKLMRPEPGKTHHQEALGLGLSTILCAILVKAVQTDNLPGKTLEEAPSIEGLGHFFLGRAILPFEMISLLLLVALVGAVYLASKEEKPPQEESEQTP